MNMYFFAILIPAVIVVLLVEWGRRRSGAHLIPGTDPEGQGRAALFHWIVGIWVGLTGLFLILAQVQPAIQAGWNALDEGLCQTTFSHSLFGPYGCVQVLDFFRPLSEPALLIIPFSGLAAGLVLFWPGRKALRWWDGLLAAVGLAGLVGLVILTRTSMGLLSLAPVVLAGAGWVWRKSYQTRWGRVLVELLAGILIIFALAYLYFQRQLTGTLTGLPAVLFQLGLFILIPLSLALFSARLVQGVLDKRSAGQVGELTRGLRVAFYIVVALLVALGGLVFFGYVFYQESLWDTVTDGMSGPFLSLLFIGGVAVGGMLMAWSLPGWRKLAGLVFAIVFFFLTFLPGAFAQSTSPQQATNAWADRINTALVSYHARTGHYPSQLSTLVPLYLWRNQQPFVSRDADWCYQAGEGYYRLGYIYKPGFGVPAEYIQIRMVASVGQPPEGSWACDEALARERALPPNNITGP